MARKKKSDVGQVGKLPFYIVGIGASAGGLAAIERFFRNMPPDNGMAFVVVQHLSPDFKSLMIDILAKMTEMKIYQVEDAISIEPNAIYLIPPNQVMQIRGNKLYLTQREKHEFILPIDIFFTSLAKAAGKNAVGIILSGSGSDGSKGIEDIYRNGGLVLIQTPESAQFDSMPFTSIQTSAYHQVLSPEKMPELLMVYRNSPERAVQVKLASQVNWEEGEFAQIFALLRRHFDLDFSKYKPTTVTRRITRRLEMLNLGSIDDYLQYIAKNREEVHHLYTDLLIGVTEFFRDPDVFTFIEQKIIPHIFNRKRSGDIRLWVAGCATGEEAYSLAILCHEYMLANDLFDRSCKIFATDIYQKSIEIASMGVYAPERLKNVSPQRLSQCFTPDDENFKIVPRIRNMVIFASHNLIQHAPFIKMDFVSCRNLLIYFEPATQKHVLEMLNYSLEKKGILFLGESEGLGDLSQFYRASHQSYKVYEKLHTSSIPEVFNIIQPEIKLQTKIMPMATSLQSSVAINRQLLSDYDELLSTYIPSGVLLQSDYRILHYFGDIHRYLKVPSGRATDNIIQVLHDELQLPVNVALQRSISSNGPVKIEGVNLTLDGKRELITISIQNLSDKQRPDPHFFVHFEVVKSSVPKDIPVIPPNTINYEEKEPVRVLQNRIEELELELQSTKENLQTTVEELQSSNEELQATNEELIASNEELQSTNEELHSVNEELYTVNAEFELKNTSLEVLNREHSNLLQNLDIGVIFVDRKLNIVKFNKASAMSFNLLAHDVGRPIEHISYRLVDSTALNDDLKQVLLMGEAIEKEVQTPEGRWLLKRLVPYWGEDMQAEGVILTFTDITPLFNAHQDVDEQRRLYEAIIEQTMAGYWDWNIRDNSEYLSETFKSMFGYRDEEMENSPESWQKIIYQEDLPGVIQVLDAHVKSHGKVPYYNEVRYHHKNGSTVWVLCIGRVVEWGDDGEAIRMVGAHIDITRLKLSEAAFKKQARTLEEVQRFAKVGYWTLENSTYKVWWSEDLYRMFALDPVQPPPDYNYHMSLFTEDSWKRLSAAITLTLEKGRNYELELETRRADGTTGWMLSKGEAVHDAKGNIISLRGIAFDITERKQAQIHLNETLALLQNQKQDADESARINAELLNEVNHRVKNNLTRIMSTFQLKKREFQAADREYGLLSDMEIRIVSMMAVHKQLSASMWRPLHLGTLCSQVISEAIQAGSHNTDVDSVLIFKPEDTQKLPVLSIQAVNIGLILSELIMNSDKYAFNNVVNPEISITVSGKVSEDGTLLTFVYRDNGPGLPKAVIDGSERGLGLELIEDTLKSMQNARFKLYNYKGAVAEISFDLVSPR